MKREVQAVLQVLLGAAVLHISLFTELYLRYVRQALRPYLIGTGVLLVLLGLVGAAAAVRDLLRREPVARPADLPGGHRHGPGGPRVAWLLVLPVLTIFLVMPGALGAYTAQRSDSTTVRPATAGGFPPLAAGDPLTLRLADFDARAVWDSTGSLTGRRVTLTGFATAKPGGGWYLARLTITCCAADARTSKVAIEGADSPPPEGSWVQVTGVWQPDGQAGRDSAIPTLTAQRVARTSEPGNPYE